VLAAIGTVMFLILLMILLLMLLLLLLLLHRLGTLLIPQEPFELLVRRSIGRLTEPALNCKVGGYGIW
jgi:hypothetical protein